MRIVIAFAFIAGLHLVTLDNAYAQCQPSGGGGYNRRISFGGSGWSGGMMDTFNFAAWDWSGQIQDVGGGATAITPGSGDVTIYLEVSFMGTGTWGQASGNNVFINPDIFAHSPYFAYSIALHELGHVIGFGHSPSCSGTGSVMAAYPSPSSYAPSFTSADLAAINLAYNPSNTGCNDPSICSPVVLDLGAQGLDLAGPSVWFDILANGLPRFVGWTSLNSEDAFLVLDRNEDGVINDGRELFGNATPLSSGMYGPAAPHGFAALAFFDEPNQGGNSDGFVSAEDAVFARLQLWRDLNQNGVSEAEELTPVSDSLVTAVGLTITESGRRDRFGNRLRFAADLVLLNDGRLSKGHAYDVFFVGTGQD